ncbi:MAG: hypothetical protein NMNS02_21840 [Nitrosomonas sp.]|nr:MAG: hypothetical protein NMNS02_21840 [Nitrosomonas sp.]
MEEQAIMVALEPEPVMGINGRFTVTNYFLVDTDTAMADIDTLVAGIGNFMVDIGIPVADIDTSAVDRAISAVVTVEAVTEAGAAVIVKAE